jgi:hypothetical protein
VPARNAPQFLTLKEAENGMPDTMNSPELRRLAMECAAQASRKECTDAERQRLLTMRAALLDLANNADWLAGRRAA